MAIGWRRGRMNEREDGCSASAAACTMRGGRGNGLRRRIRLPRDIVLLYVGVASISTTNSSRSRGSVSPVMYYWRYTELMKWIHPMSECEWPENEVNLIYCIKMDCERYSSSLFRSPLFWFCCCCSFLHVQDIFIYQTFAIQLIGT